MPSDFSCSTLFLCDHFPGSPSTCARCHWVFLSVCPTPIRNDPFLNKLHGDPVATPCVEIPPGAITKLTCYTAPAIIAKEVQLIMPTTS